MEAKLQLLFSRAMYLRNAGKREEALKVSW